MSRRFPLSLHRWKSTTALLHLLSKYALKFATASPITPRRGVLAEFDWPPAARGACTRRHAPDVAICIDFTRPVCLLGGRKKSWRRRGPFRVARFTPS